jgi:hypothetical protein
MKNSKIALLGGVLIMSILTACQDISVRPEKDSIVGVWALDEVRLSGRILTPDEWGSNIVFVFSQDNTFQKFVNISLAETGSYSITGDGEGFTLYLSPSGDSYKCWITGKILMMYEGEYLGASTLVFSRENSS